MTAQDFYDWFKHGLKSVDTCWGDMGEVQVWVKDGRFYLSRNGVEFSIGVGDKE